MLSAVNSQQWSAAGASPQIHKQGQRCFFFFQFLDPCLQSGGLGSPVENHQPKIKTEGL